uniref:Uncharacterized protein n=1 Tax=Arundo donax TaxID=35708 RepID=A0A0A9DTP6_ARUDO
MRRSCRRSTLPWSTTASSAPVSRRPPTSGSSSPSTSAPSCTCARRRTRSRTRSSSRITGSGSTSSESRGARNHSSTSPMTKSERRSKLS